MPGGSSHGLRARLLRKRAERLRESKSLLEEYVRRIAGMSPNVTVVLYGSRALKSHNPYSDYDLMIIARTVEDPLMDIERYRRLKPRGLSLDLTVIGLEDVDSPLVSKMLEGSIILYDGLSLFKAKAYIEE